MKHRLFNIITAISLLLCLLTVGLWVRGACTGNDRILNIHIGWNTYFITLQWDEIRLMGTSDFADSAIWLDWSAPCWLILLLTAILPTVWIITSGRHRWIVNRRKKLGLCSKCGYDLRASKDRCPECGTFIGEVQ